MFAFLCVGLVSIFMARSASALQTVTLTQLNFEDLYGIDVGAAATGPTSEPIGIRVANGAGSTLTNVTISIAITGIGTFNTACPGAVPCGVIDGTTSYTGQTIPASTSFDYYFIIKWVNNTASIGLQFTYKITVSGTNISGSPVTFTSGTITSVGFHTQSGDATNLLNCPLTVTVGQQFQCTVAASGNAANGGNRLWQGWPGTGFQISGLDSTCQATQFNPPSSDCNPFNGAFSSPGETITMRAIATGSYTVIPFILDHNGGTYRYNFGAGTAITVNSPTEVKLRSFDVTRQGEDNVVSWRTGHEVNNLGFRIYREDANGQRAPVTNGLVAGNVLFSGPTIALSSGRSYSYTDRNAPAGANYWLEDVDISGPSTMNGPAVAREDEASRLMPVSGASDTMSKGGNGNSPILDNSSFSGKTGHGNQTSPGFDSKPHGKQTGTAGTSSATQNRQFSLASGAGVKVLVNQEGWYHVSHQDLVNAGWNPGNSSAGLQLYVEGNPIPMLVSDSGGGNYSMEFYGTGLDTVATDTRVYWIANTGAGTRLASKTGSSGSSPGSDFPFTVERKDRVVYVPGILNGDAESWYGPIVGGTSFGPADQSVSVTHLNTANTGSANLDVAIETATPSVEHLIDVTVNGNFAGQLSYFDQGHFDSSLTIPVSWLVEGSNSILIQEEGDSNFAIMDSVALTYPHSFAADSDALEFTTTGSRHVTIPGFTVPGIRVFDISNPSAVTALSGSVGPDGSGGYALTVNTPSAVGALTLLAVGSDRVSAPSGLANNAGSDWNKKNNSADLAIISHASFISAAGPLATLRSSQGLATQVIDVADIYDEFNFGEKDPSAIKTFLQWTTSNWKKAPKYVLFLGDGSFDPRDYEGLGTTDFMPAKLVNTFFLKTASDDWFVDFNNDGAPDMAIGRLPADTLSDATTIVGKIASYGTSSPSTGVLIVGDHNDENNFHGAISGLVSLVGHGKTAQPICLDPDPVDASYPNIGTCVGAASVHTGVINAINGGVALVNWVGHGEQTSWSMQDVFNTGDLGSLTNAGHLPIALTMDCLNGYFQDPTAETMAESLLLSPNGGAAAVFASSALTLFESQVPVNQALYQQLFGTTGPRLGDAIKVAKAATSDLDVKKTFILFGDPTMKMR